MIENNKLLKAVLKRSISGVRDCVIDGEDPYFLDDNARSYLHLSVFLRSKELVLYFLEEGLDINQPDNDQLTALHRACRTGCEEIVELLIKYGADCSAKARDSITPLHIAAAFNHSGCMKVILSLLSKKAEKPQEKPQDDAQVVEDEKDKKETEPDQEPEQLIIDVNAMDDLGHTSLHYAAAEGYILVAELLIKHGADVNAENVVGNRPLHFAAASDYAELCRLLAVNGAEMDAQNYNGATALHLATQQASFLTLQHLLSSNADPNIRDNEGNTCSHLALRKGRPELLETFMLFPITDPSVSDFDENTVLHLALKQNHFDIIPMMLPLAKDLTKQDKCGCSVIIEAIKNQCEDLALKMLKTCPLLVHTATNDLVTPLHLAAERGMTNLTRQLLIAGAQVDSTDSNGLTPSLYCAKNDRVMECLAMIEEMMIYDSQNNSESNEQKVQDENHPQNVRRNSSKINTRISS